MHSVGSCEGVQAYSKSLSSSSCEAELLCSISDTIGFARQPRKCSDDVTVWENVGLHLVDVHVDLSTVS